MSSKKPIFCCTNPRACSTAFERVFMTCQDILTCIHEPFGDAYYYGPERMSSRFENDQKVHEESGFADSTYGSIIARIAKENEEAQRTGKRLFVKDIAYYMLPPDGQSAAIAPSLMPEAIKKGVGTDGAASNGVNGTTSHIKDRTFSEPGNPTVVPTAILKQFHFTFLIRHPKYSIPSYYRCTIPPLDALTGFHSFMPSEAGYHELRAIFDFLREAGQIGPRIAGEPSDSESKDGEISITVIDADDLLDDPFGIIRAYCKEVGIDFAPEMLVWDSEAEQKTAKRTFAKWKGFHEDVIESTGLRPRSADHKKVDKSSEEEDQEWVEKFGVEGQRIIRECVDANVEDYEYLKAFALEAVGGAEPR